MGSFKFCLNIGYEILIYQGQQFFDSVCEDSDSQLFLACGTLRVLQISGGTSLAISDVFEKNSENTSNFRHRYCNKKMIYILCLKVKNCTTRFLRDFCIS